jgi:hypothetical protein
MPVSAHGIQCESSEEFSSENVPLQMPHNMMRNTAVGRSAEYRIFNIYLGVTLCMAFSISQKLKCIFLFIHSFLSFIFLPHFFNPIHRVYLQFLVFSPQPWQPLSTI